MAEPYRKDAFGDEFTTYLTDLIEQFKSAGNLADAEKCVDACTCRAQLRQGTATVLAA